MRVLLAAGAVFCFTASSPMAEDSHMSSNTLGAENSVIFRECRIAITVAARDTLRRVAPEVVAAGRGSHE